MMLDYLVQHLKGPTADSYSWHHDEPRIAITKASWAVATKVFSVLEQCFILITRLWKEHDERELQL